MAALVTYGLLPRLALLALTTARLRAATAALLLEDSQVTALIDRMAAPEIETAAPEHDDAPAVEVGAAAPAPRADHGERACADLGRQPRSPTPRANTPASILVSTSWAIAEAGGGSALTSDRAVLERLAADVAQTLVVFTPAWEPPLLELLDFLAELRRRVGATASIVVTPVPDGARAVTEVERATWSRAIARLADPQSSTSRRAPHDPAALRDRRPSQQRQEQHRLDARRG